MMTHEDVLLTCVAAFRASAGNNHRCVLEMPHVDHECGCGIRWRSQPRSSPFVRGQEEAPAE